MKKSNEETRNIGSSEADLPDEILKLQEENNYLQSLLKISESLISITNQDTLYHLAAEVICELLNADRAYLYLINKDKRELRSKTPGGDRRELRIPLNTGIAGYVATTGETLNIPDPYKDARFSPKYDIEDGYPVKNILATALKNSGNEIIGVILALNHHYGPFGASQARLLESIAQMTVHAVENVRMHEEQKRSFESFIETLSTTLDARDYITSGHSRRVTLYAVEIAKLMKLSSDEINTIRYASLLHDIGKIGVPEMVLFKNKQLTEDEYEIIKRHANITKSILSKIQFQKKFLDIPQIAATHHERIDGSGYPEGLTGQEIPLGGKILSVCDVFDALTSRRHYNDRLNFDKVILLLDQETGTSFEPFVVYHFKNIRLNKLIQVLEFGHQRNLDHADLEKLKDYTLKDLINIMNTQPSKKSAENAEIEHIFNRYYSRKYRH
ncbi:MAG: HD domain-containing phosphohydrolase [Calditrichaceae bacterium]